MLWKGTYSIDILHCGFLRKTNIQESGKTNNPCPLQVPNVHLAKA